MSQFYQNIITQKSWELLLSIKKQFHFTLIGGWAVFLYTDNLKSKDIDIIIDFESLQKLKSNYEIHKNERLKKYEIKQEAIDIDIYLPYYSWLGLPVEKITPYTEVVETFTVVKKEILLFTKLQAYIERKASVKGQKDKIDILSLILLSDFDFGFFKDFLSTNNKIAHIKTLYNMIIETKEVDELSLNRHFFSQKKKEILNKLSWK
ncbi:hypothetical protein COY90_03540 [Candidatus Roizmanbacteria bacterium CG_4_10_14_0_8_um_filter_39_9]|uniref:Uncharacterized protein n=1 Tax=Candidatus Roizmanbacteria bacterium CG_4_10_14_0_8_um_filter_39_9 TaxID=1974829 RepID=A0A2M7QCD9_9BACT|nr:MAG: hypothetical protein COY90_03540 [Candidatus Roizmanbacteria bacterium CG_4_10_14_0_8_um_filter_39_9]